MSKPQKQKRKERRKTERTKENEGKERISFLCDDDNYWRCIAMVDCQDFSFLFCFTFALVDCTHPWDVNWRSSVQIREKSCSMHQCTRSTQLSLNSNAWIREGKKKKFRSPITSNLIVFQRSYSIERWISASARGRQKDILINNENVLFFLFLRLIKKSDRSGESNERERERKD